MEKEKEIQKRRVKSMTLRADSQQLLAMASSRASRTARGQRFRCFPEPDFRSTPRTAASVRRIRERSFFGSLTSPSRRETPLRLAFLAAAMGIETMIGEMEENAEGLADPMAPSSISTTGLRVTLPGLDPDYIQVCLIIIIIIREN